MNKHRFRIIFNQLRGLMMVVAENVKSHSASAESGTHSTAASLSPSCTKNQSDISVTLRPLAFSLMCALGLVVVIPNPININRAHAEVKAATNVPGNQQSTILRAPNGVEVVNIPTPSAAGVSRSVYEIFNVVPQGLIINNSSSNTQTELGGWIPSNPWLATGSARIILIEVNSSNPSYLNGYTEIAGRRAEFIIANPNGISCNGCGFINASRTVLTTGTPILSGGDLTGYRVTGGTVRIIGNGMDASRSNYTDIIARAVEVNAGIWANDLKITTGANTVNAANTQATAITGSGATPNLALDVAALGGMYAGKITMIGTEVGLGVRNAGIISANVGHLTLDVNGNLTNSNTLAGTTQTSIEADHVSNTGGRIISQQQLALNAISLSGDGQILAGGNANLNLTQDYTQTASGTLQANGNLTLTTAGNVSNQSAILSGQTLTLNAANLDNSASGEISGLHTKVNIDQTLTNRGLIDGGDTFIHTGTLNNLGTGAIFGDHVAIAADTLNNLDETLTDSSTGNTTTTAAVIAARNRMDIGAKTINNRNNALLFSAGDMAIGGALDANHLATVAAGQVQADTLNNSGATIEALGNLDINAVQTVNSNAGLLTRQVTESIVTIKEVKPEGWSQRYDISYFPTIDNHGIEAQKFVGDDGTVRYFEDYYYYKYDATTQVTEVVSSQPGQILSGGNMTITGNLTNDDSQIIAGGTLSQIGGTLQNISTEGIRTVSYDGTVQFRDWDGDDEDLEFGPKMPFNPATQTTTYHLGIAKLQSNTQPASGNGIDDTAPLLPAIAGSSLFTTQPDSTANYLLETNPRFANYRTWLSSDYLLTAMSYDPATVQKRLGDGFYEQRLIREQINQLTGQRFLTGYANDEQQYQALMTNGATFAQVYQLIPGVALTAAQIAQLTSDIVWLVEQTVTLADGTTVQALVPQVYLVPQTGDLQASGALIAGQNIHLQLEQDVINQGTIAGRDIVHMTADNIHNLHGTIQGNITALNANQDINNLGGTIAAQDVLILQAGHDITSQSTTQSSENSQGASDFSRTNIDRIAGLYVSNPNGLLLADVGNDIHLIASVMQNQGSDSTTQLNAGNNINLGTLTIAEDNSSIADSRNYVKDGYRAEIGSSISTGGNITLTANHDINARAANVTSESGSLTANAGNNLTIESGTASRYSEAAQYKKKSGTFSSKSKQQRDTFNDSNVVSSTFSGEQVNLSAQNDITVKGSNVVGTNNVNLNAGNNITIQSAQATHDETHYYKEKKSGFTASSTSIGYSTSKLTTTNDTQTVTNVGSIVGSVQGDVNINAGSLSLGERAEGEGSDDAEGKVTITGSDVLTPQGDINITAQSVDINAATDTYANQQTMKYKQSGITLSISNPVISAAQTVNQMKEAAKDTSDSRMQALAAGTSALAVNNAANAVIAGNTPQLDQHGLQVLDANGNNTAENPANQVGGINISLSIGTSKASSSSSQSVNTAKGSTLNAGGNINITATGSLSPGERAEGEGDINVTGSQLTAADDVTLTAQNAINLQAAHNVDTLNSKNKNSSASLGVSVGTTSGFAVTAGVSQGKGKTNGNGSTWTETRIQGGNQQGDTVTLNSGTDTNLIGAQVSGNQVQANVGISDTGNLNIESLQDTNAYNSKQNSAGISVTVPIGAGSYGGSISASSSKINSNYQSVNEQAGIFAGDGGFQVNVNGNTNLTGAVIASTDKAIQDNANSLTTQTLTTSNIENSAAYEAEGYSIAAGVGTTQQPGGKGLRNTPTASAGISELGDDSNSVTVSGISGGTVNITDPTQQQTQTGQDATTTVAMLNRDVQTQITAKTDEQGNTVTTPIAVDSQGNNLAATLNPIFDQAQVQSELDAQIQITQAFSQVAPKAVGDYASSKLQEAANMVIQANDLNNGLTDELRLQLINEANTLNTAWQDGGYARVALHTVVGGLTGNLEGAIGAGTSAITIPMIGQELAKLDIPATLQQALVMATAAAIGGVVGDMQGASAALSEATNNYLTHQQNLNRQKAIVDCSEGDTEACNQAEALNALDEQLDLALHDACDGAKYSDTCRSATIEMRQALATYFASTQANKPLTAEDLETNPLLSSYTHKDELQSYVPLIQVSNSKLTNETLGNAPNSQSPNLYNGDPYGVINRDILQNYVVVKVGEQWAVIGSSDDQVYTNKAGVNGMQNSPIYAPSLMGIHVEDAYVGTSVYTLAYVPNNSFTADLLLSLGDKLGLGGLTTSSEANFLSGVLQNVQANGEPVDWVAHSRGGVIFTQAANINSDDLSKNTILFHSGANNELVTLGILNDVGIKYGIGTPDNEQSPYKNSDADLVPNIVGFNGNPIQIIKSIIAIPDLSQGPLVSPHTLPFGYIVAPPRYTTPYTEVAP